MIAYLEGRLLESTLNSIILVTDAGLGYEVFMPAHSLSRLPQKGARAAVFTSQVVREDAHELFGFDSFDERRTFDLLRSLNKVGARTALGILSVYRPDDLRRLVLDDDPLPLTRVSGIGKKTAQTIFLELKFKLKVEDVPALTLSSPRASSVFKDALAGLLGLGYSEDEAGPVLKNILESEPELDVSGTLRSALRALARIRSDT